MLTNVLVITQLFFSVIIGLYFFNLLKTQQSNKSAVDKESQKEMEKLRRMRAIKLTQPLSEKTRPKKLNDIIGQSEGIKALKAAICGPNPQHVLIYGPPGVGKTCAARLVLEEAKNNSRSPFKRDAKFFEMDATCIRFDERSIADPLIGSVHDPIYQGAGPMGVAGIPQPKPGAVTKAHGGMLFLDEIGELHHIQMNKLLKVLEDRKVFLESAYYNSADSNTPKHIHEIFQNGLPADFRLVGATTCSPQDIPPAIRSRCLEIFFRGLTQEEIKVITENAAKQAGFDIESKAVDTIGRYAQNGRDCVNIIQLAAGLAITEDRFKINTDDIEWVLNSGHYSPRPEKRLCGHPQVGVVYGLAVYGANIGTVMEIEAAAVKTLKSKGEAKVTGIVAEEEMGNERKRIKRKSSASDSVDNVITVLKKYFKINCKDYDLHLNFPGGVPIDGPSAGISITTAIYSAVTDYPVSGEVAMTGEISIRGEVNPVGGITSKIEAAVTAGAKKVIIPEANWQDNFKKYNVEIIPVSRIEDVIKHAIGETQTKKTKTIAPTTEVLSAEEVS